MTAPQFFSSWSNQPETVEKSHAAHTSYSTYGLLLEYKRIENNFSKVYFSSLCETLTLLLRNAPLLIRVKYSLFNRIPFHLNSVFHFTSFVVLQSNSVSPHPSTFSSVSTTIYVILIPIVQVELSMHIHDLGRVSQSLLNATSFIR